MSTPTSTLIASIHIVTDRQTDRRQYRANRECRHFVPRYCSLGSDTSSHFTQAYCSWCISFIAKLCILITCSPCAFLWSLLVRCFELWRFCAQSSTEQHRCFKSAHCWSKVRYIAGARVGLLRGTALPSWDEVSIWTSKAWDEVSYNR